MKARAQLTTLAIAALLGIAALPAYAGNRQSPQFDRRDYDRTWPSTRQEAPPKDCTRIVGRYGYYGNPWCNAVEQRRWDLWETRKRR